MENDQTHQCADFTRSVAAQFDRLWAAIGANTRLLQDQLEFQQRQNELAAVQIELVRDEIDDLEDWMGEQFEQRLDAAVGEAALARIETDRIRERLTELADRLNLRIAEVEVHLASASADVGAAVQTERLDELERAIDELGAVSLPPTCTANGGVNGAPVPAPSPASGLDLSAPSLSAPVGDTTTDTTVDTSVDASVMDSMTRLMETMHRPVPASPSGRGND